MKKILATLILSFMILTLLVGCTTSASQNNSNDNNSDSQNTDNNSGGSTNEGNNGSQGNQGAPDIEETPPEYIGGEHPGGVGGGVTDDEGDESQQPGDTDEGEENQGGGGTSTPGAEGGVLPEEGGNTEEEPSDKPTEDAPIEGGVVTPTPSVGTNVGDLFGDVKLETVSGGVVDTADYRGKILIVNIWATWCPPCKAELPDFNRIASEYAEEVVIVAAHTPSGNGNALSYVNTNFPETNIIFAYDTVYSDAYLAAGGIEYVPQTAIIDQNGIIIYSDSGMMTYEQVMAIIEAYL